MMAGKLHYIVNKNRLDKCKYRFELTLHFSALLILKLPENAILPLALLHTLRVLLEVVFVGVIFPRHRYWRYLECVGAAAADGLACIVTLSQPPGLSCWTSEELQCQITAPFLTSSPACGSFTASLAS